MNELCKRLIVEAKKVGSREMEIRRGSSGIAGVIAEKITHRQKFDGDQFLSIEDQAAHLEAALTQEELSYANKVWG